MLRAKIRRIFTLDSFSARLLVRCTVSLILTMTVATAAVVSLFKLYPSETLARHAQYRELQRLVAAVRPNALGIPVVPPLHDTTRLWFDAFPKEVRFRIIDGSGHTLSTDETSRAAPPPQGEASSSSTVGQPPISAPVSVQFPGAEQGLTPDAGRYRVIDNGMQFHVDTQRFVFDGRPYYMQLAISERAASTFVRSRLQPVYDTVILCILLAIVIFAVSMRHVIRRMLQPITAISQAAANISPSNLTSRLALEGVPSELRPFVGAFKACSTGWRQGSRFSNRFWHLLHTNCRHR